MQKPDSAIPIYHGRQWPVGLTNAAKRIGVSKGHLYLVLKGRRQGARVKAAYDALIRELNSA